MVEVGLSPVNLEVVGDSVWVPNDAGNTISRIDVATARVTETIETAANPAVVSGVGGDVWASMFDAGQVWRIRPG